MNKLSNITEFIKKSNKATNEEGFSLIELVVAVGILAILSVTGVVAYSSITDQSRRTATDSAASEVYRAAVAAEADGDTNTTPKKVVDAYNATKGAGSNIHVSFIPANTSTKKSFAIIATNTDFDPAYNVTRGGQIVG